MSIVGGHLGELSEKPVTECVRTGLAVCSTDRDIALMRKFLVSGGGLTSPSDAAMIVEAVKKKLGVEREVDIYEHKAFQNFIGHDVAQKKLSTDFKPKGPSNSTALLDNFNIDEALDRWAAVGKDEFGKKFYHVPFQMIDFVETRSALSKVDPLELKKQGYNCFGVVINTDVSTGGGIHWFCIYGDLDHAGTVEDPIQLEYFNSSGYTPRPEMEKWLRTVEMEMLKRGVRANVIYATGGKQIQYSKTECGVWSLVYIYSRLLGKPYHWMANVGANDNDMIEYRQRLFRPR